MTINKADFLELFDVIKKAKEGALLNLDIQSNHVIGAMGRMRLCLFALESKHIGRLKKIQKQISCLCKAAKADPGNVSDDDEKVDWAPKAVFMTLKISKGPLQTGIFRFTARHIPPRE